MMLRRLSFQCRGMSRVAASNANRVPILHWFRTDLRLDDNSALAAAAEKAQNTGRPLVPCYIIDPNIFGVDNPKSYGGVPKIGQFRARFILDCVKDLRKQLDNAGYGLLVAIGSPEVVFKNLIESSEKRNESLSRNKDEEKKVIRHEIFCNYEIGLRHPESWYKVDAAINTHWGPTLYHIDDLPEHPYHMNLKGNFSLFMSYIQQVSHIREPTGPVAKGDAPVLTADERKALEGDTMSFSAFPALQDLGLDECPVDDRRVIMRGGGETAGMERINEYLFEENHLPTYWHTREQFGKVNSGSRLSPWLAQGCISPRRLYGECVRYEQEKRWQNFPENDREGEGESRKADGSAPAKKLLFKKPGKSIDLLTSQLLWRDFYHFLAMDADDRLFELGGFTTKVSGWNRNEEYIEAWKTGKTGYPLVDANMRELAATGFISSRGRSVVASFLALDLKVDWRIGAEYFESTLVDHDVSTNWGNWLNSAGLTGQTKGRPNKMNSVSQARKFDKHGDYVKRWVTELANVPYPYYFEPWKLSKEEHAQYGSEAYPAALVDATVEKKAEPRKMRYGN